MASAVLVTGDEDIRVGVQQAQEQGARVYLVGVEPKRSNQSGLLAREADKCYEWGLAEIGGFLAHTPPRPAPLLQAPASGTFEELTRAAVDAVLATLSVDERNRLSALFAGGEWRIPRDVDIQLIRTLGQAVDPVGQREKIEMRTLFKDLV